MHDSMNARRRRARSPMDRRFPARSAFRSAATVSSSGTTRCHLPSAFQRSVTEVSTPDCGCARLKVISGAVDTSGMA